MKQGPVTLFQDSFRKDMAESNPRCRRLPALVGVEIPPPPPKSL